MIPILPSSTLTPSAKLTPIVADDRAVIHLIEQLIEKSGLSQSEIARRLGIKLQSLNQFRRKKRPGLIWIAKLAEACGGRLMIEFAGR